MKGRVKAGETRRRGAAAREAAPAVPAPVQEAPQLESAAGLRHHFGAVGVVRTIEQPEAEPTVQLAQPHQLTEHSGPVIQRKFRLAEPEREDSFEYVWVENDQAPPDTKRYRWGGRFVDIGGKNEADLLFEVTEGNWYCIANMFGAGTPSLWQPHSEYDREMLRQAEENLSSFMLKKEPAPQGEIGKMNFRFPPATGVLYHSGAPPQGFEPQQHPNVRPLPVDESTLRARQLDQRMDNLGRAQQGLPTSYDQRATTGTGYVYIRTPQERTGVDTESPDDRSKFIFSGQSVAQSGVGAQQLHHMRQRAIEVNRQLPALQQLQEQRFVGEARGMSRDAGQVAAMRGLNAAAYAMGMQAPNAGATDWEWLHIRGARLGGKTNATNLVAGTSSTNSHMIPYEHQILELSKMADQQHPLFVFWTVAHHDRVGVRIIISWKAPNGLVRDGQESRPAWGSQSFDPVRGAIYDRLDRDLVWTPQLQPRPTWPPVPLFGDMSSSNSEGSAMDVSK